MDGEEPQIDGEVNNHENKLNEKKKSWGKLFRPDSFSIEAGQTPTNTGRPSLMSWRTTMSLAFQSLGVVYGDIGTSPLYVYASTFTKGIKDEDDVIGVLSLIIYTITLVALLKYVFIVLQANDNGEGGTFALYSLICRYAKMGLIPNQEPEDRELSNYALELPTTQLRRAHMIKEKLENSKFAKIILFLVTIMGTSMVIGDGILTPSISVLSAVSGIKSLGQDTVVGVSVAILIILFAFQRFGTDKVGFSFAPIILLWFAVLTGIGLFNLFKHDITVLKALNPLYIISYFRRTGRDGWISLGGVFLCITGTEAMFADLGHFSVRAVQISFSCVAYPALVTIYCGQAAYLTKHTSNVSNTFYNSIPDPIYWPTFVLAVAASIIASQAMISGAFSIISQSLRMGCFPRVKVVHTSAKYEGQVYIPEINYLLMLACIAVTLAFRTTEKIGHAYGIAVVTVMVITTFMVTLIMLFIWKTNIVWIALFLIVFGSIEMLYLSSVMYKFTSGGYLPLAITVVLMAMMAIWQYVHVLKYRYELREKISPENAINLATSPDINRVPGIGLFYTELVHGITPLFSHYISNLSSVHSVFVLISIKTLPVNRVTSSERFFFRYVGPKDSGMFRCVVRYGYKEDIEEPDEFERQFAHSLKEFIHHEHFMSRGGDVDETDKEEEPNAESTLVPSSNYVPSSGRIGSAHSSLSDKIRSGRVVHVQSVEDQTELLEKAREKGIVYLMGETEITAEKESSLFKKFIVNHAYNFLKKNCREGDKALAIPRSKLLKFHGGGLKASADGVGIRMNTMWRETRSVLIVPVFKYLVAMCLVISLLIFMESVYMNLVVLYVKLFNRKPEKVYKWEAMQGDMELGHQNYPMALVQIPMYNEREVFELSIGAACRLVWPSDSLIIQVLDDSTDPAIMEMVSMECAKWASKDINIKYERRDNRNGYKAGALKHGMRHSYVKLCDYLAIFDADFQPEPDYLQRAIPFLIHNPELALVQARWKFVNVNTCLMTRIQEMSLNYHFMAEQQSGSTIHDFFGFNRTAGVWRIRAMEEAGGWKDRTTVEDMDLAVRVGLLGWKFVFINDLEVKSELPSQFKAFRFQQHRWSCGPANLFRKMMMEIIHNKRVKIWKKFYVIYSFFFLRKIIVHFFTFFFYCVVLPTSVFLPEVAIPTWSTIYGPSIITLFGIIATPRSFYLVVFWVLFENVMAMHRTKGTLIGLFDGGRANEWVVTEKLGGTLKTKLLVRNGQILKRVNLKEMMMGIHILCCACYDFAFGNTYLYLYLFMQATAFLISGVGFVGT